jgi:tetratricopeptide (TPR) repeat protein
MRAIRAAWWRLQLRAWLLLGRQSTALERLAQWLAHTPDDVHALATLAHLRAARGEHSAARQALLRVVELQPGLASHWFNLGFVSEQAGLPQQAEAAFGRATALDPRLDRAWYGLALSLIAQRRFDEAVDALRKTTELQPMSPFGWYQLARVHVDRREPEQAAQIFRHLRGFEPRVAAQLVRETGLGQA